MNIEEHLKEDPRLSEWYLCFSTEAENLAKQGYHLVPGWPADEYNLGWNDYISWCHAQLDEVEEGADVQPFPTYVAWRDERMPEEEGEFSWHDCELCRGKAGNRYAVSAVRHEPYDYIALSACASCYTYVSNGEFPEEG